MRLRRALAVLPVLSLLACYEAPTITVENVFDLSACPPDFRCEKVADGRSPVTVEVCVKEEVETRADEKVTLALSSGRWEGEEATVRSISRPLQEDRCTRPSFITDSDFTSVRVDAELVGFSRTLHIALQPAPIVDVELSSVSLPLKAGQQNQLQLRVDARNRGTPTRGSSLRLTASAAPATAQGGLWPDTVFLDDTGTASVQLLATGDATEVSLKVTVFPPETDSGAAEPLFEKPLTLPVSPPPEG